MQMNMVAAGGSIRGMYVERVARGQREWAAVQVKRVLAEA
jgi:hypothetical protein